MRDYWAVTTCPRPGLPNGYAAGLEVPFRRELPGEALHIFDDRQLHGQCWNFLRALGVGLEMQAERLHIFEDDVLPCLNAFRRIAAQEVPTWATFVDWCALRIESERVGFAVTPTTQFLGLQAVTFTRASAIEVVTVMRLEGWPHRHLGDVLVARALSPGYYARHFPGLFDHIGLVSVCNPAAKLDAGRTSRTFDPGLDAATLAVFE